jgi:hypothetical protein
MHYLYVCAFSNGHTKVGRSINPESRIASHAERVSCMGIELVASHTVPCASVAPMCETELIDLCAEHASERFRSEWFAGLEFKQVCEWANTAAAGDHKRRHTRWTELLEALCSFGVTQMQIAEHCGCNQTTISALKKGRAKEPLHSLGEKLIRLHEQHRQLRRADVRDASATHS